uniref:Reverse transcriptase domain-containing protein n=1 Tax=Haemonchus placei TaxID=6290 RepID=A0A0N4WE76_HAEPC
MLKDHNTRAPSSFKPCLSFYTGELPSLNSASEDLLVQISFQLTLANLLHCRTERGEPIPKDSTATHVELLIEIRDSSDTRLPTNISDSRSSKSNAKETDSPSHFGFRRKHSTFNHIYVLNQVAKKSTEYYFQFMLLSLVTEKFSIASSGPRPSKRYLHPELMVMLQRIYEYYSTFFIVTLIQFHSPSKEKSDKTMRHIGYCVNKGLKAKYYTLCFEHAGDVTLLASSSTMLENVLQLLQNAFTKIGLILNPEKCELLTNSETSQEQQPNLHWWKNRTTQRVS